LIVFSAALTSVELAPMLAEFGFAVPGVLLPAKRKKEKKPGRTNGVSEGIGFFTPKPNERSE
jgi:hypothetical protein